MTRKTLLLALTCLGLVEAGVLVTGWRHRNVPARGTVAPAVGLPNRFLPDALSTPALYVEPAAGFGWIDSLVQGAKGTLDLTMYELEDPTFSGLLVQACQRGVKVRVLLDQSLEKAANTPAFAQLAAAGPNCTVAWSNPQFQATHQKTLIVDGNRAVVLTANLTSRYYATSRDLALIDTDTADVGAIQATFDKDFGSTTDFAYEPDAGHNLIWSPTTAGDDLVSFIAGAHQTLLVENEELASATIVQALGAACKRGVRVSLAMTDTSAAYHPAYAELERSGCGVHVGPNDPDALYVHAKAMVADLNTPEALGYVGSINFSDASLTRNRELGLYVHDPALLQQIASTLASDFQQFPAYGGSAGATQAKAAAGHFWADPALLSCPPAPQSKHHAQGSNTHHD